uniref:Protein Churchill n=1 Tax=Platynereis dumerilii TaxID=6359 RepID=C3W8S6_PLADU|nr:churchill zinc finger protein [Platynereis dumerilii]
MCQHCVRKPFPQKDTVCLEGGAYFLNYQHCINCNKNQELKVQNKEVSDNEEEEVITFQHVCSECGHTIANHEYRFCIQHNFQVYQMSCLLCGHGEHSRTVMPNDPRHLQALF